MYIFLDIDGVLVKDDTPAPDNVEELTGFDTDCQARFEDVVNRHASAKIVIVSLWREMFNLQAIRGLFSDNVAAKVIGAAPLASLPAKYFRYQEIIDYLGRHDALNEPWLVISCHREHFPPPALVIAPNPEIGFADIEAEELDKFLGQAEAPEPLIPVPHASHLPPAILGLAWDGTLSAYSAAFAFLARRFSQCVIITLNDEVTLAQVAATLNLDPQHVRLEVCPAQRITEAPAWKVEQCRLHNVELMFDDDEKVVQACRNFGIHAITVNEIESNL